MVKSDEITASYLNEGYFLAEYIMIDITGAVVVRSRFAGVSILKEEIDQAH